MPNRIADLRADIQSLDQAHRVFDDIAQLTLKLAAEDAKFEKRVGQLKVEHDAATADDRAILANGGTLLARFIEQHKALFADPRKIKTAMGSFGLQAVNELAIDDADIVGKYVQIARFKDCFKPVITLVKTAIKKRIESGIKIPGARIVSGDTAVYKVDKVLIDAARNHAVL